MYTKANRLRKAKTEILVKKNTQLGVLRIGKYKKQSLKMFYIEIQNYLCKQKQTDILNIFILSCVKQKKKQSYFF